MPRSSSHACAASQYWRPPLSKSKLRSAADPQRRPRRARRAARAARSTSRGSGSEPRRRARATSGRTMRSGRQHQASAPPRRRRRGRRRRRRSTSAYVRSRPVWSARDPAGDLARARADLVERAARRPAPRRRSRRRVASERGGPVEERVVQLVEVELVLEHASRAPGRGTICRRPCRTRAGRRDADDADRRPRSRSSATPARPSARRAARRPRRSSPRTAPTRPGCRASPPTTESTASTPTGTQHRARPLAVVVACVSLGACSSASPRARRGRRGSSSRNV